MFVTSPRGHPMLVIGSYKYCLHRGKSANLKKIWVCSRSGARKCRASVTTVEDQIVSSKNDHNHY
ncbi:hypothetical protein JYU34_004434 [Plutella xylostella]|uniref:FLYWCH-type domain-containing protein n=1 Tax=Plutella xylostella TaxID=51655 RepID=A0ABQ7QXY7_PLUXY|nr:hypothetical protein JYU34_004434 [Plutella xylostella]